MVYREVDRPSRPKRRRNLLICLCVILLITVVLAVTLGLTLGRTSSDSLKATIMSRCETYLKEEGATTSRNDCEEIWNSFKQAFVGRNSCDVPPEAYDSLIHTVSQDPQCGKTLFWSKTKELAHTFTEERNCYLTLEDTLLGYMLDNLTWCGKYETQDIFSEITECPAWDYCVNNPVRSFWIRASAAFAASACGDASVMLNGSIDVPFNSSSVFASVEVKHFNSSIMNSLTVLLVTKKTEMKTCENDASLKDLQNQLDPKLKYICKTVPQTKIQTCISQPHIACGDCW